MKSVVSIETNLPRGIRGVEYMRNHHYVKLTFDDKTTETLWARKTQQGKCPKCGYTIYIPEFQEAEDCLGLHPECPRCHVPMVISWGEARLAFFPEEGEKQ